ncbi:hypothetical protein Skr01_51800 [Sphaerisporangium krabiense]|uniref:Uncharacterized protein n=1 Tax=Sphaerisporangium krabiense TaxID=763782 RepID=A0A7W9DTF3_9ACTN|nr:hypothetical protein [Sphaerisporangium krabiense]MBB5630144.1 hypothetical protein [Sphaerisporangium krabiense]GII65095.1 hypothetical protein Skr01_51800 [Sphaerisporangium krabiense]
MVTPEDLEKRFTLVTATARYDHLRAREALSTPAGEDDLPVPDAPPPLTRGEALEVLALGEVIARKAGYGRQLAVRAARAAGASWSQIGAALGTSKQAAWEAHTRWIDDQAERHRRDGYSGMGDDDTAAARVLAGGLDEEPA